MIGGVCILNNAVTVNYHAGAIRDNNILLQTSNTNVLALSPPVSQFAPPSISVSSCTLLRHKVGDVYMTQ